LWYLRITLLLLVYTFVHSPFGADEVSDGAMAASHCCWSWGWWCVTLWVQKCMWGPTSTVASPIILLNGQRHCSGVNMSVSIRWLIMVTHKVCSLVTFTNGEGSHESWYYIAWCWKIVSSSLVQLFDFSKFREQCLIYM